MKEFIEITSQIAGIFSLLVAIIALIFIKPISNYFTKTIKNNISQNENKIENNYNGATINNYGGGFNQEIVSKIGDNLDYNNIKNGK